MMNLKMRRACVSYIRTHKQTVTHRASITKVIINVKKMYPALYTRVIDKVEEKYKINIIEARSWEIIIFINRKYKKEL